MKTAWFTLPGTGVTASYHLGVDGLSMPGVSRFKLGMGGELYTLAGTYL